MKIVNVHANRYLDQTFQWKDAYTHTLKAFVELGFTLHIEEKFRFVDGDQKVEAIPFPHEVGHSDHPDAVNLYNHSYIADIKEQGLPTKNAIFLKPTGPSPAYFTLDTLGYAGCSSITYTVPDYKEVRYKTFFNTVVKDLKEQREHKWSRTREVNFIPKLNNVPEDHVLILGQMPGDETVTQFSFGNHWLKIQQMVNTLKKKNNLVLKLHPTFKSTMGNYDTWDSIWNQIMGWMLEGVKVYSDSESLHDILPHTKAAVVENTTAGIECLMYNVPVISYGFPEYHWVTKDLRHICHIQDYIDDLSWWDGEDAARWLAWYCTKYQCSNYSTTLNRVEEICTHLKLLKQ